MVQFHRDSRASGAGVVTVSLLETAALPSERFEQELEGKRPFSGLPVGILFGVGTCLLISEKWDPVHLRPKGGKNPHVNTRWQWSIPLGVLAANIIVNFFDSIIADLIAGVVGGWLYITLGYIAFQVWRHRTK